MLTIDPAWATATLHIIAAAEPERAGGDQAQIALRKAVQHASQGDLLLVMDPFLAGKLAGLLAQNEPQAQLDGTGAIEGMNVFAAILVHSSCKVLLVDSGINSADDHAFVAAVVATARSVTWTA